MTGCAALSPSRFRPYLFDRSIADNVAYASDAPDGQRIEEALRASGLGGFVRERGADFAVGPWIRN